MNFLGNSVTMLNYCFVCASNEGIFLDVAANTGDTIQHHLQTCLSIKVDKQQLLSSKICHKCVYELNQCTTFVERYKQRHETPVRVNKKKRCDFCVQLPKQGCLFDLSKDNHSQNDVFQNLRKVFKDYPICNNQSTLICLTCRYTLDLLIDLKDIFEESKLKLQKLLKENADYFTLPKTKTLVASRKTTVKLLPFTDLNFDIETNTMARGNATKSKRNRSISTSKIRKCDKCSIPVMDGVDMYRFYRTGLTVCKTCWETVDPEKNSSLKQTDKNNANLKNTKLCSVFLKDVLKSKAVNNEKLEKTVGDNNVNKMHTVTDESSEGERKHQSKRLSRNTSSDENLPTGSEGAKHSLRSNKIDNQVSEKRGTKRKSILLDYSSDPTNSIQERSSRKLRKMSSAVSIQKNIVKNFVCSDSEISVLSNLKKKRQFDSSKLNFEASTKRIKNIKNEKLSKSLTSNEDSSSSEEIFDQKARVIRPSDPKPPIVRKRGRPRKYPSLVSDLSPGFKRPAPKSVKFSKLKPKKANNIDTEDNNVPESQPHNCSECGIIHDNRLLGLTHELTHYKQLHLKLKKIDIASQHEEVANETIEEITDCSEKQALARKNNYQEQKDASHEDGFSTKTTELDSIMKVEENAENADLETIKASEIPSNNQDVATKEIVTSNRESKESVEEDQSEITEGGSDELEEKKENSEINAAATQINSDEKLSQKIVLGKEDEPVMSKDNNSVSEKDSQNNVKDLDKKQIEESSFTELTNPENNDENIPSKEVTNIEISTSIDTIITSNKNGEKTVHEFTEKAESCSTRSEFECIIKSNINIGDADTLENSIEEEENDETMQLKTNDDNFFNDFEENKNEVEEKQTEIEEKEEEAEEKREEIKEKPEEAEEEQKEVEEDQVEAEEKEKVMLNLEEQLNDDVETESTALKFSENAKMHELRDENRLNDSASEVADVLREVFDLASGEIERRLETGEDSQTQKQHDGVEETLENISFELYNGGDMPSLEPINISDVNTKDESLQ